MRIPFHLMSEANVQAEFYGFCKEIGLNCVLELHTPFGRVDCAIFSSDWKKLLAVVECKHVKQGVVKRTMQIMRYKRLGVPVYGLAKMDSMALAKTIKEANHFGIVWDEAAAKRKFRQMVY